MPTELLQTINSQILTYLPDVRDHWIQKLGRGKRWTWCGGWAGLEHAAGEGLNHDFMGPREDPETTGDEGEFLRKQNQNLLTSQS